MKIYFVLLVLFFSIAYFFNICSCVGDAYELENRHKGVDASVGCPGYDLATADIGYSLNSDIATLVANTRSVPGLYMDAIAGLDHEFIDDSRYVFSGEWKLPFGAVNEMMDINIQRVEDHTEYHAEILWGNNPFSPLYGWIWTRIELDKPIKLFYVGIDNQWHKWKIVVDYIRQPKQRIMRWIEFDKQKVEFNIAMGTNPKEWKESFQTLLETHNMYTGCSPLITTVGRSEWRNVSLKRIDLP